jgi:hypothetical protein
MWLLAMAGGGFGQNPASSPASLAGEVAGEDHKLDRDLFVVGVGVGVAPVSLRDGARRRRLWRKFRRGDRRG